MTRPRGVQARLRHHVRLEVSDVDVQRPLKAKTRRQSGDDVHEQAVQVGVHSGSMST